MNSCQFGTGDRVLRHGLCGTVVAVHPIPGGGARLTVRLDAGGGTVQWGCSGVQPCPSGVVTTAGIAICGAPTRTTGEPCKRRVPGGGRCHQHVHA